MNKQKTTIAIAEDLEDERRMIVELLGGLLHCSVGIAATNGRELIWQLGKTKKLPQILLIDMQMPCCDGLLCAIICKRLYPAIKIVGLSSHTSPLVVSEFMAEGGNGFLSKYILPNKDSYLYKDLYKDEHAFYKAIDHIVSGNGI